MVKIRIELRDIQNNDISIIEKYVKEKKIHTFYDMDMSKNGLKKFCSPDIKKIIRKAIILKETKDIIGVISIGNISKKNKRGDIGYRIGKNYEGMGLMKESMMLIIEKLFKKNTFNRIQAYIRTDNLGSIVLAEKIGFKKEGVVRKFKKINNSYFDFYLYGLLQEDFLR